MPASLDIAWLNRHLAGRLLAGQIHHIASTPSTNTLAIEAAQAGVATGVWVADEQTAGRGRGGHTWHSAGDGLYMSVLLRPHLSGTDVLKLSLAAAIACADGLDLAYGAAIHIRWPNDLMAYDSGKKVGGILTESALDGRTGAVTYAVVGIGINLNQQTMPPDLEATATSVRMTLPGHPMLEREPLLAMLLSSLEDRIRITEEEAAGQDQGQYGTFRRFENNSPMTRNLHVHVDEDGGYNGVTDGLEPSGLLRIRMADGTIRLVRHGGVRPA